MKLKIAILLFLSFPLFNYGQEINIVSYLKQIEAGDAQIVKQALPKLKSDNPNDPSVMFLDAVLTEDGNLALTKYKKITEDFPKSNYADAALYRVFSYYYSLGSYKTSQEYLTNLKTNYPDSPYIKAAERKIPEEDFDAEENTETPAVVLEIPAVSSVEETYNFTVQAGAFLNVVNAKSLADQIQSEGYEASLSTKEVGGSILNIVTAGKFKTENEASILIQLLKTKYKLNGRIIPIGG